MTEKKPGRTLIAGLAFTIGLLLNGAWLTMLYAGAAHSQDHRIPAVGFWLVFFVLAAARTIYQAVTMTRHVAS